MNNVKWAPEDMEYMNESERVAYELWLNGLEQQEVNGYDD